MSGLMSVDEMREEVGNSHPKAEEGGGDGDGEGGGCGGCGGEASEGNDNMQGLSGADKDENKGEDAEGVHVDSSHQVGVSQTDGRKFYKKTLIVPGVFAMGVLCRYTHQLTYSHTHHRYAHDVLCS